MSASERSTAVEYDALAPYYDAFTKRSDYEAWTDQVLVLARRHGLSGERLLDLACGTGKSFLPFLRRGFSVTACDCSAGMLAEAARAAPGARLERADLRRLPDLGAFDLVTCFDDSFNYLLGEDELAAAFAGVEAALAPGGLAMFDLNSLLAYRVTFASDRVTESDGVLFAWRGTASPDADPGCRADALLDVVAPIAPGVWSRVTTGHRQRHFTREVVLDVLAAAGLDCVAVHGVLADCSLVAPADESRHLKVLYTARRTKGGDAK